MKEYKVMEKAIITLTANNHEMRTNSIRLKTIFGDVFAPKSKTNIINGAAMVPTWVFYKKRLNPCQMVDGFIGIEKA